MRKRTVKVGDLVRINRASIGVPTGTMGLIIHSYDVRGDYDTGANTKIYELQLLGSTRLNRRFLDRDLEVINEAG